MKSLALLRVKSENWNIINTVWNSGQQSSHDWTREMFDGMERVKFGEKVMIGDYLGEEEPSIVSLDLKGKKGCRHPETNKWSLFSKSWILAYQAEHFRVQVEPQAAEKTGSLLYVNCLFLSARKQSTQSVALW